MKMKDQLFSLVGAVFVACYSGVELFHLWWGAAIFVCAMLAILGFSIWFAISVLEKYA